MSKPSYIVNHPLTLQKRLKKDNISVTPSFKNLRLIQIKKERKTMLCAVTKRFSHSCSLSLFSFNCLLSNLLIIIFVFLFDNSEQVFKVNKPIYLYT